jgi:hypothetical protein
MRLAALVAELQAAVDDKALRLQGFTCKRMDPMEAMEAQGLVGAMLTEASSQSGLVHLTSGQVRLDLLPRSRTNTHDTATPSNLIL